MIQLETELPPALNLPLFSMGEDDPINAIGIWEFAPNVYRVLPEGIRELGQQRKQLLIRDDFRVPTCRLKYPPWIMGVPTVDVKRLVAELKFLGGRCTLEHYCGEALIFTFWFDASSRDNDVHCFITTAPDGKSMGFFVCTRKMDSRVICDVKMLDRAIAALIDRNRTASRASSKAQRGS